MEEQLKRGKNSPGLDSAFDLAASFADHPERADRYPSGTTFIAADLPDAPELMARAVREKRPFTLVFPDGSDLVARPPEAVGLALVAVVTLAFLLERAGRNKRRAGDAPLYVPRSWTTELHSARPREAALA
jgi:hypothetical protein